MATVLINLENGHPKVEPAMTRLRLELATLRRIGVHTVKIIHGYGSTGVGGALRQAARRLLCTQLQEEKIKAFCPGEQFGPFENAGRSIIALAPALRQDPDWGRQNDGITMVVLR